MRHLAEQPSENIKLSSEANIVENQNTASDKSEFQYTEESYVYQKIGTFGPSEFLYRAHHPKPKI